jgi:hypothetical protein
MYTGTNHSTPAMSYLSIIEYGRRHFFVKRQSSAIHILMVSVKIHHVRVRFSYSGDVKRSIRNIYNYHNKLVVMVQVVCYYFFS